MRFLSLLLVLVFACSSTTGAQPDGGLDGGLDAGSDGGLPDAGTGQDGGASVLQHHNRATRAGLYTDPALTKAAAAGLHRDQGFDGALDGNVYAQPLYVEGGAAGKPDVLLTFTESNEVAALDPITGAAYWRRTLAPAVRRANLDCGNIDPLGITGTPVADAAARTVYVAAMTTPDNGATLRHRVYALSIDGGGDRAGFPVDVEAAIPGFASKWQNQRGALLLLAGTLFVPYGAHAGDCGTYAGTIVAVPTAAPQSTYAWRTRASKGGIWAPSGLSSDGASVFAATGNTEGAAGWGDGEAALRFPPSAPLAPADWFYPANWKALDGADTDIGSTGVTLFDVPGATPSALAIVLGKDGKAYLLARDALGGLDGQLASATVASGSIITAPAVFNGPSGATVVFSGQATTGAGCPKSLGALRITPGNPPAIQPLWCADLHGRSSVIATTSGAGADLLVWGFGGQGDNRLRAYDGETGAVVFGGGGPGDAMGAVHYFQTPIVARGRLYVAGHSKVYAFTIR